MVNIPRFIGRFNYLQRFSSPSPNMHHEECCCYQDLWCEYYKQKRRRHIMGVDGSDDYDICDIFFQLANSPLVSFRVLSTINDINDARKGDCDRKTKDEIVVIEQDVEGAAHKHTGGIVWETAYLLLEYLIHQMQLLPERKNANSCSENRSNVFSFLQKDLSMRMCDDASSRPRTIIELGAGCGMLGLALHKCLEMTLNTRNNTKSKIWPWRVILTETAEVMHSLRGNYHRNYQGPRNEAFSSTSALLPLSVSICELDWTNYQEHCRNAGIDAHSVDLILGTDVVFSSRLVEPLLRTIAYISHDATVAILCLQERCPDSHALLLDKADDYGFVVEDISKQVFEECDSCRFGKDLDCTLLLFTRIQVTSKTHTKKRRKEENLTSLMSRDKQPKVRR
jgi:hypothetical protein